MDGGLIFMVRLRRESRIEVWSSEYINDKSKRRDEDRYVEIIQIEHGIDGDYMVEVIDKYRLQDLEFELDEKSIY